MTCFRERLLTSIRLARHTVVSEKLPAAPGAFKIKTKAERDLKSQKDKTKPGAITIIIIIIIIITIITIINIIISIILKVNTYKTIILLVVLYGCETWSLALREEHRSRVFENKVGYLVRYVGLREIKLQENVEGYIMLSYTHCILCLT